MDGALGSPLRRLEGLISSAGLARIIGFEAVSSTECLQRTVEISCNGMVRRRKNFDKSKESR